MTKKKHSRSRRRGAEAEEETLLLLLGVCLIKCNELKLAAKLETNERLFHSLISQRNRLVWSK